MIRLLHSLRRSRGLEHRARPKAKRPNVARNIRSVSPDMRRVTSCSGRGWIVIPRLITYSRWNRQI